MEVVATLSLAANIVQFIDFGTRTLSKGKEIYDSSEGTSNDNLAIEAVVRHLKDTLTRIRSFSPAVSSNAQELQDQSTKLIDELLRALEDLKVKGGPSKWKSIRKALKSVRSKKKLEEWLQRLESMREEYNTQLEVEILETIRLHGLEQQQCFQSLSHSQQAATLTLLAALRDDRDAFDAIADQHANSITSLIQQEHESTRTSNSADANVTRATIIEELKASRTLSTGEHTETQAFVKEESSRTTSSVETAQESISAIMQGLSADQKLACAQELELAQEQIEDRVSSEGSKSTSTLMSFVGLTGIVSTLLKYYYTQQTIKTLSEQLTQTRLLIEEYKRFYHLGEPKEIPIRPPGGPLSAARSPFQQYGNQDLSSKHFEEIQPRTSGKHLRAIGSGSPEIGDLQAPNAFIRDNENSARGTGDNRNSTFTDLDDSLQDCSDASGVATPEQAEDQRQEQVLSSVWSKAKKSGHKREEERKTQALRTSLHPKGGGRGGGGGARSRTPPLRRSGPSMCDPDSF